MKLSWLLANAFRETADFYGFFIKYERGDFILSHDMIYYSDLIKRND